jgi:E3 ubiquitin-protein ligase Hakai
MVNLKIRLSNKSGSSPGIVKNETANGSSVPIISSSGADLEGVPSSSVLPPHLVGEDLALARGLGTVSTDSSSCVINLVGVKARRRPGDKVHICVRCNFPIAVYGRLVWFFNPNYNPNPKSFSYHSKVCRIMDLVFKA